MNRGRHLYSAGRPSRWALAHILVVVFVYVLLYLNLCLFLWRCQWLFYLPFRQYIELSPELWPNCVCLSYLKIIASPVPHIEEHTALKQVSFRVVRGTQGHWQYVTDGCDVLITFRRNYVSILYRFRILTSYLSKIAIFTHHVCTLHPRWWLSYPVGYITILGIRKLDS